MAKKDVTTYFRELLLQFIWESDTLLTMLEWLTERMLQLEAETRAGATKGKHSSERRTHLSSYRVRRFDTRLGTLYLMVTKLRSGG